MAKHAEQERLLAMLRACLRGQAPEPCHDTRDWSGASKNLLATGELEIRDVVEIVEAAAQGNYSCLGPHHGKAHKRISDVHLLQGMEWRADGRRYYVKWYWISGSQLWFISVHPLEKT